MKNRVFRNEWRNRSCGLAIDRNHRQNNILCSSTGITDMFIDRNHKQNNILRQSTGSIDRTTFYVHRQESQICLSTGIRQNNIICQSTGITNRITFYVYRQEAQTWMACEETLTTTFPFLKAAKTRPWTLPFCLWRHEQAGVCGTCSYCVTGQPFMHFICVITTTILIW